MIYDLAHSLDRAEIACASSDGLILLRDPTVPFNLPVAPAKGPVSATTDCILIRTVQAMGGDVTLVVTQLERQGDGGTLYRENLNTPGRKLAFCSSDGKPLVEAKVKEETTFVAILGNDLVCPRRLVCVLDHGFDPFRPMHYIEGFLNLCGWRTR